MKTYLTSKDQKTVYIAGTDRTYTFKKSNKPCSKCGLYSKCIDTYTDDNYFPFPCTSETRTDRKHGIFIDEQKAIERKGCALAIVSITLIALAILIFFGIVPNFMESIINTLWDSKL